MGLDWDKIRKEYEAKAAPEELQEADWAGKKKRRKPAAPRTPKTTGEKNYWRGPRERLYDQEAIVAAYLEGMTCREVAAKFSCHETTVRNYVKAAGVYNKTRDKSGSKPKDACKRGHVYEEVGYFITPRGYKNCKACSRIRTNEYRRQKRLEKAAKNKAA